jgi:hypothetical protein
MSRKYSIAEMRKKNKAAGHFWFQGRGLKYRDAYGIVREKSYYDGKDNWFCVTYITGKKTWHWFDPVTGKIGPVKAEQVPKSVRDKA